MSDRPSPHPGGVGPDWPVLAAGAPPDEPAAVVQANRVVAARRRPGPRAWRSGSAAARRRAGAPGWSW